MVEAPDLLPTSLRPCLACEWSGHLQVELAPGARVDEADGGMNGEGRGRNQGRGLLGAPARREVQWRGTP